MLIVEEQEIPVKGNVKRAYKLVDIIKHQPRGGGSAKSLTSSQTADAIKSISDLFAFVKRDDKVFSPKEATPELLNSDGTPKVMYHGTNESFTVFDRSKGKKKIHLNVLGNGNYFTARREGAEKYGNNVIEAYLNIKRP